MNSAKQIKGLQEDLEKALYADIPNQNNITALTKELEAAYKNEELFWRQKSRIQWLHSGDRNTGFFHAITRSRRMVNNISVIENAEGQACHEEAQISEAFASYYQEIFTTNNNEDFSVVEETLTPLISQQINDLLITLPDAQEVKDALFSIHADKAPYRRDRMKPTFVLLQKLQLQAGSRTTDLSLYVMCTIRSLQRF